MTLTQKIKDFFGITDHVDDGSEVSVKQTIRKKEPDTSTKVHVSTATIVKFWAIGAGIVFLTYIAFQSLEFLYLVLTAYILSIALEAIVMYLFTK